MIRGGGLRSVYPYAHILARYVRGADPHLVVSALQGSNAVAVCAAELTGRAVPVVVTVRNNVAAEYAPQWLTAARTLYPLADAVVAVSGGRRRVRATILGARRRPHPGHLQRHTHRQHRPTGAGGGGAPLVRGRGAAGGPERRARDAAEEPPHPGGGVRAGAARDQRAAGHPRQALGPLPGKAAVPGAGAMARRKTSGFVDFDENPYRYMRRAGLLALSSRWEGLPTVWSWRRWPAARRWSAPTRPTARARYWGSGASCRRWATRRPWRGRWSRRCAARRRQRKRCARAPPTLLTREDRRCLRGAVREAVEGAPNLQAALSRLRSDEIMKPAKLDTPSSSGATGGRGM